MPSTRLINRCALALAAAVLAALPVPSPAAADPSVAELDRRIADAAHRLEVVVEEYNGLRENLRATTRQSRALGSELAPLLRQAGEHDARVAELAAGAYRRSGNGPTVALLAASSPDEFVHQLVVLDRFARERHRALDELTVARQRVATARRTLDTLAGQQRQQQRRLAAKKQRIEREIAGLRSMRARAYPGGFRLTDTALAAPPPYVAGPAGKAVGFAFDQLGKPYQWGAAGPGAYDCSGLTLAAWAAAGVRLPHNSRGQWDSVARISRPELRPGDLVFYYGGISHVAIYVGGGRIIHAPEYGELIRVDPVDYQPVHGYGRPR